MPLSFGDAPWAIMLQRMRREVLPFFLIDGPLRFELVPAARQMNHDVRFLIAAVTIADDLGAERHGITTRAPR